MTSIDFDKLKRLLDEYVKPRWEGEIGDYPLRYGGGEPYVQDTVLNKAAPFILKEELIKENRQNLINCLQSHRNLLAVYEGMQAKDFLNLMPEDQLKKNFINLLYGSVDIFTRLKDFFEWCKLRPTNSGGEKKIGINPTVISYYLAISAPRIHAYCKPTVYTEAVKELIGAANVIREPLKRIVHCSEFYTGILQFLEENYGLENGNLLDVHTLFYSMKSGFGKKEESIWTEPKKGPNNSWIFQGNPKYYDVEASLKALKQHRWSVRQHKKDVKAGDRVYIWNTGPDAGILALGTTMTDPAEMTEDKEAKKFIISEDKFKDLETRTVVQIDKVLDYPVKKSSLINHPILANLPNLKNPQGTNFTVTPEQDQALQELIQNGPRPPIPGHDVQVPVYSKTDALKNLFIEEDEFDYIMDRLRAKKNIILQGAPGVGKTFLAKRLAYYLMGFLDDNRVSMIQFHQSYSYEDFIQGFRPNQDGKFNLRNGIFHEFCTTAMQNENKPYVFIIDEINRGNLSKIFGEMLMLIESDKRGPDFSVPLTYGNGNSDKFYIPSNIFLIGTMNTADRSLAMVDYALRRRFGFINLKPQFKNPIFYQFLSEAGIDDTLINLIIDRLNSLNETIADDTKNLGPGYQIGHSYFCPNDNIQVYNEGWYWMIIRSEIEPLLQEYWFDDPKRVADKVGKLLSGV